MAGFVWGQAGAQLTPDQIAAERKVADALIANGTDASPIKHWSQGMARVAQALLGGYTAREANNAAKANATYESDLIREVTGGTSAAGATSPAPMASTPPEMSGGTPTPVAMAPSVSGKIYSNDEPSPLDPPSGKDRDLAIRTVFGEDPGTSAAGVANVIRNRMVAGKFGGDTVGGVVLAKNQFEPWNREDAKARMMTLDPNSDEYKRLGAIVDQAWTGTDDPTKGATHFFSPSAQAALGRPVPKWGMAGGQDIGTHRFFGGAANPTSIATAPVPPATVGARAGGPVTASATTWGDKEAEAAGLYEAPASLNQRFAGSPGAPADPAALPPNAQPAQYVAPGTGEVIPPTAAPTAGSTAPASSPFAGINPRVIQGMASPNVSEGTKKILGVMLQQQLSQQGVTTVDVGDAVVMTDKRGNEIRRFPKGEPVKGAEFGVIGKDQFNNEKYGWKNPRSQSVTPYTAPGTEDATDSKIPPAPPGVDPKIWRESLSKAAVAKEQPAPFDDVAKVRGELAALPSFKNMSQAAPIYKSMHDAAGRNTKAADLNMVYGLGKIMDPGSVVREGEIVMANNAQGWQEKLNGIISQIQNKGALTPEGRQALMAEAHSRMSAYKGMYDQDADRYRGIAKRNRMNPDDVVHDFGEFQPWLAPKEDKPGAKAAAKPDLTPGRRTGRTGSGLNWSVE